MKRYYYRCFKCGVDYTEEVIVEDKPKLTAKDVSVEISNKEDKPKIKISFDI